jgi:3-oxoacyl-[acyl-carrier-protein] synthase-3
MFYQVSQPEVLKEYLQRRWPAALVETTQRIIPERKLDYLAMRHLAPIDYQKVTHALDVNPEHAPPLYCHGHHGTNDVIISLDLGLKSKAIQDGSSVVLVSGGIGFTYAAALVQWGPRR